MCNSLLKCKIIIIIIIIIIFTTKEYDIINFLKRNNFFAKNVSSPFKN